MDSMREQGLYRWRCTELETQHGPQKVSQTRTLLLPVLRLFPMVYKTGA